MAQDSTVEERNAQSERKEPLFINLFKDLLGVYSILNVSLVWWEENRQCLWENQLPSAGCCKAFPWKAWGGFQRPGPNAVQVRQLTELVRSLQALFVLRLS